MRGILKHVLDKLTSARFVVTIMVTMTYCLIMYKSLGLYATGTVSKDFFFGLLTGFTGVVSSIITFYFTRPDRKNGKGNDKSNGESNIENNGDK